MNEFQSLQNNLKSKKELFKNEKWDRTQKFNEIINDALNLWPKISNFLNNRDSFDIIKIRLNKTAKTLKSIITNRIYYSWK